VGCEYKEGKEYRWRLYTTIVALVGLLSKRYMNAVLYVFYADSYGWIVDFCDIPQPSCLDKPVFEKINSTKHRVFPSPFSKETSQTYADSFRGISFSVEVWIIEKKNLGIIALCI
jgi:hypothetical protein